MIELLIVLALIGLNGLFALSELAVVSARQPRLKAMANAGRRGAQRALALRSDPGRFLSSVQIGITLIGIVNGAFSGETFGEAAAEQLMALGVGKAVAGPLGFGLVIVVVTYLSIIVGELVPKSIALRNPDAVACLVAPSMTAFARFATPAVWLLDASTRLVFRLLGQSKANETRVTDEEIRMLIAEAETAGVLERGEREMIAGVMRLADRGVSGVMTPRTDVEWIDVAADVEEIRQRLATTQHSRLPVGEGADRMIGVVQARELLAALLAGERLDIRTHTRVAPIIPETTDALDVLNVLRTSSVPVALVHDEYGHFMGLVTPADVLEVISGVFKSHAEDQQPLALQRDDGAWVLAGGLPVDEMAERLGIVVPAQRGYETVAGFALAHLQRIPAAGDHFITQDWRFDVTKLNGNRIGAVLATRFIGSRRTHSG
ncbi:MAG: hemolysin family protein [Hyphomicrobium sp.]